MREIPPQPAVGMNLAASEGDAILARSPAADSLPVQRPAVEPVPAPRLRVAIDARKLRDPESGVGS